jgi:RNA polymerase sigma-70 factor (ECF subfamily)
VAAAGSATVTDRSSVRRFEQFALPHLDAAYNLARWLTRNDHDAEDAVQEAYLRAFKYFGGFAGANGRAWILAIVRHACYDLLNRNRRPDSAPLDDAAEPADAAADYVAAAAEDPESLLLRAADGRMVNELVAALPTGFREVIVLRELEDLSYREIADVVGIPVGTVMSRIARGRALLRKAWTRRQAGEP